MNGPGIPLPLIYPTFEVARARPFASAMRNLCLSVSIRG